VAFFVVVFISLNEIVIFHLTYFRFSFR